MQDENVVTIGIELKKKGSLKDHALYSDRDEIILSSKRSQPRIGAGSR